MTSNLKIPTASKEPKKMAGTPFAELLEKKMTKKVKFMGSDVEITKLSVEQVLEIQESAKKVDEDESGIELLRTVIRFSVTGADEIDDDQFTKLPLDELTKLSNAIMSYSGLGDSGNA